MKITPTQKVTKKDVNKCFRELRDWQNCIVLNFSSDRKNRGSFIGKTDYEIVTDCFVVMGELKLYNDKLKIEQINYAEKIINIGSDKLIYLVITEENYLEIKRAIATGDMTSLRIINVQSSKIIIEEKKRLHSLTLKRK